MRRSTILPTRDAQRADWDAGKLTEPEELRAGWWSVPTVIPVGSMPGTLGYLHLGREGVQVIDPGWDCDDNLSRLERVLDGVGRDLADIDTVIVTHHHPDHLGLADRLRALSGATLVMSEREAQVLDALRPADDTQARGPRRLDDWGVPHSRQEELIEALTPAARHVSTRPDQRVADGEVIDVGGRRLEAMLTPGHTGGHLCLVDADAGMVFTGDHVLPRIHSGLGIGAIDGDEPISQMLESLDRMAGLDELEVLPGHEFRFTGLAERCAGIAAHHLRRAREVAAVQRADPQGTLWSYASALTWTSGWEGLSGFFLLSALNQTELHVNALRQGCLDPWLSRG